MLSVAGITLNSDAYDQRGKGRCAMPHSTPTDQHAHTGIPFSLRVSEYPFPAESGARESLSLQVILRICLCPDKARVIRYFGDYHRSDGMSSAAEAGGIPTIAHYSGQ